MYKSIHMIDDGLKFIIWRELHRKNHIVWFQIFHIHTYGNAESQSYGSNFCSKFIDFPIQNRRKSWKFWTTQVNLVIAPRMCEMINSNAWCLIIWLILIIVEIGWELNWVLRCTGIFWKWSLLAFLGVNQRVYGDFLYPIVHTGTYHMYVHT